MPIGWDQAPAWIDEAKRDFALDMLKEKRAKDRLWAQMEALRIVKHAKEST